MTLEQFEIMFKKDKLSKKYEEYKDTKGFNRYLNNLLVMYGLQIKTKRIYVNTEKTKEPSYFISIIHNIHEFIKFDIDNEKDIYDSNKLFNCDSKDWIHLYNDQYMFVEPAQGKQT